MFSKERKWDGEVGPKIDRAEFEDKEWGINNKRELEEYSKGTSFSFGCKQINKVPRSNKVLLDMRIGCIGAKEHTNDGSPVKYCF